MTDLSVRPYDARSVLEICGGLRGSCDAVLIGEHQNRPDLPPVQLATIVSDAGLSAWITLTCRDRNRIVLEQELAGLALTDAAGVLCVTGDGRASGTRPDGTQVFDLDSTQLVALAAATGLPVAVAEAPAAPPHSVRPRRVLSKQRACADLCFLKHVGVPADVASFVEQAPSVWVTLAFVPGVAVYTDERSARVLQSFPGLLLAEENVQQVLDDEDPEAAGIDAAVAEALQMLALEGVVGVNLSGLASARGERHAAEIKLR